MESLKTWPLCECGEEDGGRLTEVVTTTPSCWRETTITVGDSIYLDPDSVQKIKNDKKKVNIKETISR